MKVKVELGHFAEEASRDKLLKDSSESQDEHLTHLLVSALFFFGAVIAAMIGLTIFSLTKDYHSLIVGVMEFMIFTPLGLTFMLFSIRCLIQGKHESTIAYLKKLHNDEKEQEEVVKK